MVLDSAAAAPRCTRREKLGRQWIGIDVTHLAIGLIEKRLRDAFPGVAFQTHGVPQDLAGARDLAARGQIPRVREVGAER